VRAGDEQEGRDEHAGVEVQARDQGAYALA
jgi:hypothetical protein